MNLSLNFIELSSYIGPPQGYADEPSFEEHIWPLFLRNIAAVENVFLFVNGSWSGNKRNFEAGEKVSANIAGIGKMEWLSNRQLKEIQSRSFFGGHLNVLYQINSAALMLKQIFRLYPLPSKLSNEEVDTLGIERAERLELIKVVQSTPDAHVLASFAHDADPLYIFGSFSTLKLLLQ